VCKGALNAATLITGTFSRRRETGEAAAAAVAASSFEIA
jgi:hypothetical protein